MAQNTPVGLWKTIDDDGKTEKSLVRITESGGVLTGKIEKHLRPDAKADAVCDKCADERKDKPIVGMTIIRNVKQDAGRANVWDGGHILDPNNGKTYTCAPEADRGRQEARDARLHRLAVLSHADVESVCEVNRRRACQRSEQKES